MLTDKEAARLREELQSSQRPLYFFHDDPDGLASYIMCQHFVKQGRGVVVKAQPHITMMFMQKVQEIAPDKVFILDIAMVDQEFIDACPVPVIWVDHHEPQKRERVTYMNPLISTKKNVPTPALIRQATHEDLWLATVGCIGDWYLPPFAKDFSEQFPDVLPATVKTVEEALFDTPVSMLVKAFSFVLKGKTSDVNKLINIMTQIESPYEILNQTTPRGKLIHKQYEKINALYITMLEKAFAKIDGNDTLLVYTYVDDNLSLTKDLANELLYRYRKVIVLGRERQGEVRCSLRSPTGVNVKTALEKALVGVEGYGGGHANACGAAIKKDDFPRFIENLRRELVL